MSQQQHIIDALEICTLDFVTYTPQRFLALHLETGRVLHIIGLTNKGNWLSDRGYVYPPDKITNDLVQFAHHRQLDAADLRDTQADALT